MRNRLAVFCILTLSLPGTASPVWAAHPGPVTYSAATRRVVAHALIQKAAQLQVQYDMDEQTYKPTHPKQGSTEAALCALHLRLTELRPDGYRHELAKAVRRTLTTRIAAQEVKMAMDSNSRIQQSTAKAQILNLRRHLTAPQQASHPDNQRVARL